jgi:exopolysaccharide biosynthesis predicted pyruvyltransferase EpsI
MHPAILLVRDTARELTGRKVYYCPNPGNAGDALIAHATYNLLREHSLEYLIVPYQRAAERDLRDQIVVFGGGGSFNALFGAAARFVERFAPGARRLIVLPQTVASHEALLGSLGEHVTLFCRERVSFQHARAHARRARVQVAEDLVLSLDVAKELHGAAPLKWHLPRRRKWLRAELEFQWRRWRKARSDRGAGTEGVLNCFRGGLDRPDMIPPPDNIDASALLGRGVYPEAVAQATARRFLGFLAGFETINTNRLHVAIGGALMGKAVNMYPNTYYKNQAVFEFSLKDRFPRVRWMGGAATAG